MLDLLAEVRKAVSIHSDLSGYLAMRFALASFSRGVAWNFMVMQMDVVHGIIKDSSTLRQFASTQEVLQVSWCTGAWGHAP